MALAAARSPVFVVVDVVAFTEVAECSGGLFEAPVDALFVVELVVEGAATGAAFACEAAERAIWSRFSLSCAISNLLHTFYYL